MAGLARPVQDLVDQRISRPTVSALLVVYGPVGFLLGPIVIVVAISVLEIVRVIVYEEMEPSS